MEGHNNALLAHAVHTDSNLEHPPLPRSPLPECPTKKHPCLCDRVLPRPSLRLVALTRLCGASVTPSPSIPTLSGCGKRWKGLNLPSWWCCATPATPQVGGHAVMPMSKLSGVVTSDTQPCCCCCCGGGDGDDDDNDVAAITAVMLMTLLLLLLLLMVMMMCRGPAEQK